jgi:hypothetical protein
MSYGLIDYNTLRDIGDSIRFKTNSNRNYYPRDMARAINQIRTGDMGFDEPVSLQINNNTAYLGAAMLNQLTGFEQINVWPENDANGSYTKLIDDVSWSGISPDKISLYFHPGPGGLNFGLYVDGNKWAEDQSSIIDISNLFGYASNLKEAYCGKYTSNMHNTYYYCYNLIKAACGPYVNDMSYAYYGCSNLSRAVVGERVTNMAYSYCSCSNLTTAEFGPNVTDISYAYAGCYNLTGNITIPSTTLQMANAFGGCSNLQSINGNVEYVRNANNAFYYCINAVIDWANFNWANLYDGNNLYSNRFSGTDVGDFPNLVYAGSIFENCHNLVNVGNFSNKIISADYAFKYCYNLSQESHDKFINSLTTSGVSIRMYGTFISCYKIKNVHVRNTFNYASWSGTYSGVPIENLTFDPDVNYVGNMLQHCEIVNPVCPDSITNASFMYYGCRYITDAVCGNNVTNMGYMYWDCSNLINAVCGINTTDMHYTYYNCQNLLHAACGDNVINMWMTYQNCPNLIDSACGNNVVNMFVTYNNCTNLQYANIGPSVINIYEAFENCIGLNHDVVISNENLNMLRFAFRYDNNLQNIAIHSKVITANKQIMENAFYRNNYSLRRNIVLTNLASFNNFIIQSYNSCGYFSKTNETYAEPLAVNVNGVEYNAVRCAYNTIYNCYIYCTE